METAPTDCDFQLLLSQTPALGSVPSGRGLWPGSSGRTDTAVCSGSPLLSFSLAPQGLMVVAGVACEAVPWP